MQALERLNAGDLSGAIRTAQESLKAKPADPSQRFLLADLLCFRGDFERAEGHYETVMKQSPDWALPTAMARHLVRAASMRQHCFVDGAVPEFVAPIDEVAEIQLRLWTDHRGGDAAGVQSGLERLQEYGDRQVGQCDGKPFVSFRDLDDSTLSCLEVMTDGGKYYWVPWHRVEALDFEPVTGHRDLLWRTARLQVRGGPDATVHVPVQYPATSSGHTDALLLGRETDWEEYATGLTGGIGQRVFMAGDEEVPVLEIKSLRFDPWSPAAEGPATGDSET